MAKVKEREKQYAKTIYDIKHIRILVNYFLDAIKSGKDPINQNAIDFPFGKSMCKSLKDYVDKLIDDYWEESEKEAESEEDKEM